MCNGAAMTLSSEKDLSSLGSWLFVACCSVACCCHNRLEMKGRIDIFYWATDVVGKRINTFFRPHFLVRNGFVLSFGECISLKACLVLFSAILFGLTLFLTKIVFCGMPCKPVPSNISYCYGIENY